MSHSFPRYGLPMITAGGSPGFAYSFAARNGIGYLGHRRGDAAGKIPLAEARHQVLPADAAHQAVGQVALQAVAHFDAVLVILDGYGEENPVVLAFLADTPFHRGLVGEVLDGLSFQG